MSLNELDFKGGLVEVKASLRDDPSFKGRLQQQLKGHVAKVVKDAHTFAEEVVELVRTKTKDPDKKVVFIIDSVEQIRGVGSDGASDVYKSVENLFSGHAESLHIPMLHVVYTIPPYLSALAPGVGRVLGGGLPCRSPSIYIRDRTGEHDETGLDVMQSIVSKRCEDWEKVVTHDQLQRISLASGGDLREFFRLISQCLIKAATAKDGTLPMSDAIIERTENHLRQDYLPIAEKDKEWLRKIAISKSSELESIEQLPQLARFFDSNLVLNNRHSKDWYDVHPLLTDEIRGD